MDTAVGKRGLPKFRDILRRAPTDSEADDAPDLEFLYADSDQYSAEMCELYSYTEEPEFMHNQMAYEELVGSQNHWTAMSADQRRNHIMRLLDLLDVSDHEKRMSAVCALLYIAQGTFGELSTIESQLHWSRVNCFMLYDCGVFSAFVEFLCLEFENGVAASAALRKPAVSMADCTDIRAIINVLYTILETVRWSRSTDTDAEKRTRESLKQELLQPTSGSQDSLCILLFAMVTKFCGNTAPHFPMKKVLLLLWKVCLMSLGGLSEFYQMKNAARAAANLPPLTEDTHEVCRNMRASSPPASAADLLEHQQPQKSSRSRKSLSKQSSMDDPFGENTPDDDLGEGSDSGKGGGSDDELPPTPPRPATPTQPGSRSLPWTPKVRPKDLEAFLDHIRSKFVGFQAKNDCTSLVGLPLPIHEGVKVLKQHLYTSLAEVQIQREEEIAKSPMSIGEEVVPETPAEVLYRAMLPNLPQYMIALLKILLAAAPTSKTKSDSINILADILPEEMPNTVLQSMKLGIDVNRHKEIIVKAIAALLILLLKMFKLNHMYQFEYMSQHLVFANCIPLVLKFFNQNISAYVTAKNSISMLDFPSCVIGRQPELTAENLEAGDSQTYCWRNLFSCINLLRIVNKLTKWKHSRTMMLVVFKSAPILKRALKVRQAMMQLYILKLIKMQTKYLGRQWRKSNMKTMSAIYQKVRHRLTDDWAYGNDMDARPWDFQAEECSLRASVDRFNSRRYAGNGLDPELQPVDNCILSVLGQRVELSEDFKKNYEVWLDNEVYSNHIDWDRILTR